MGHFDDLELVGGGILDRFRGHLDAAWPGFISLQYCAAGRMYFGKAGNDPARIERPALFWSVPGPTYRFGPLDAQGWSHHWVTMRGFRIERLMREVLEGPHPAGWRLVRQPSAVRRCIRTLIACARRQGPLDTARAAVELEQLALLLASEEGEGPQDPQRAALIDLAGRIAAEPARSWSWEFEARHLGWSLAHLRRRFTAVHGQPPHRYLLRCRVQLAADSLREHQRRPLADIAALCGFASVKRLTQAFELQYGLSPGRFRGTVEPG